MECSERPKKHCLQCVGFDAGPDSFHDVRTDVMFVKVEGYRDESNDSHAVDLFASYSPYTGGMSRYDRSNHQVYIYFFLRSGWQAGPGAGRLSEPLKPSKSWNMRLRQAGCCLSEADPGAVRKDEKALKLVSVVGQIGEPILAFTISLQLQVTFFTSKLLYFR